MATETPTATVQGSTETAANGSKAATPSNASAGSTSVAAPAAAATGTTKAAETVQPGTNGEVKPAETKTGESTETKPATESKPAETKPGAPEKYDLKLPDKASIDASTIERISGVAKELGLPQDAAQKMLGFVDAEVAASRAAFIKANNEGGALWTAQLDAFEKDALADAEIGGTPEKLKESAERAKRVAEKLFSQPVRDFLQKSGLGSHKDLVRDLSRLYSKIAEDKMISAATTGGGGRLSDADVLYGTGKKG